MLSETLVKGLGRYKIGQKVRSLRLEKNLGLVELGKHTSLSPALLSKIERGLLVPTLPTLLRIALVFSVGLDYFFVDEDARPAPIHLRKSERVALPDQPDAAAPCYFFESLDFPVAERKVEAFYAEFPMTSQPSEPHQHAGSELIFVIRGQLVVDFDGQETVLDAGDSLHFDSGTPHSYRRSGRTPCSALVMVAP